MQGLWVEVTSLVGQGESFLVLPPLCGTKETSHDLFLQVSRGVLMFSPLGSQIQTDYLSLLLLGVGFP